MLHTRECHSPDLSDCPPAKRERGNPGLRIGDVGPMGRVLIAGEPGAQIIAELAPHGDEWVIDKPGKGMFWVHGGKFEVCEITLKNRGLKKEQFIEEADFTPSGVVRIAKLQKQGFAYIKP